jgi:esterase/lipase superfamily enzyme
LQHRTFEAGASSVRSGRLPDLAGCLATASGRAAAGRLAAAILLIALAGAVSGCAGRPGIDALMPVAEAAGPGEREHVILVASTRQRDRRPGVFYNGERESTLSFARFDMTVPPTHAPGQIEFPKQAPGNPATDMMVREAVFRDTKAEFLADLKAELAARPPGQRKAAIFVHGYNTQFNEAMYRILQLTDDSRSPMVPVLFTWASRGKTEGYLYDNNSATAARDGLEETIRLVFDSGAEEVTILAHSMGNWVTVEALRQIKISGNLPPIERLGAVVLAAPDIDVDVFKTQLKRFGKPAKPFIIIVSRDDKALGISDFLAGDKLRVGAYTDDEELVELGAVVIDMTKVKSLDGLNHGKFAQLAEIAPQMRALVAGAAGRRGAAKVLAGDGIEIVGLDRAPAPPPGTVAAAAAAAGATPAAATVATTPPVTTATPPPVTTAGPAAGAATAAPPPQ